MFLQSTAFKVSTTEPLAPDDEKAADIFSRIGYSLEDALSDLVDNSIDAEAKNVLIRFVIGPNGIHSVVIADDGSGMDDEMLREAMRFGSRTTKAHSDLGKYGIGLKSASLSQAQSITVVTRKGGKVAGKPAKATGRRWTTENIKRHWACEILDTQGVTQFLNYDLGPVKIRGHGTVVMWEHLEHLKALPENLRKVLDRTTKQVANELGLRFHRFIESGQLSIYIDEEDISESPGSVHVPVIPLNPFNYEKSGNDNYPKKFRVALEGQKNVELGCHIWPPKSKGSGYRLGGGKISSRQGFYFYRNNRLIQAGGWNKCRDDDSEPHLSLARVLIDLPPVLDSMFKLDVAKSKVDPPPMFAPAVVGAVSGDFTFKRYWQDAQAAYRKQKRKESAKFPFVPGSGFPMTSRKKVRTAFHEPGTSAPHEVDFRWRPLGHDEVVSIDAANGDILLNSKFRKLLTAGSDEDAAIIKLLMLLLFQERLGKTFETEKGKDWLQRINYALLASLRAN